MNLNDITNQGFILALFIRDDGERFLLGSGFYEFNEDQLHFAANIFNNDIVEVQGNDGVFLAGQVRRAADQMFDGYIGDATINRQGIEAKRRDFFAFFRKNYYYNVVYVFPDGSAIQRKKGFIVEAPEVKELYQKFPEYHVALNFEDVNYYTYSEDDNGEEIYGKVANVPLATGSLHGGLIWDEYGVVWDNLGATWEEGSGGGVTVLNIESIDNVYPVWEVKGPASQPWLENVTAGVIFKYGGNITATQTLVIDMLNKTAKLNGVNVLNNIDQDSQWFYLKPGDNRLAYTTDDNEPGTPASVLKWQEVVG